MCIRVLFRFIWINQFRNQKNKGKTSTVIGRRVNLRTHREQKNNLLVVNVISLI